jgi:hypothetical protein
MSEDQRGREKQACKDDFDHINPLTMMFITMMSMAATSL